MDHVAPPAVQPPTAAIEVRADRIDGALDLADVTLEGRVRIRAGRAVLRADRLRLRALPGGDVEVDGPLTLTPCDAASAPIAFGVARARLDSEGGATLRGVRVLAFGHTVFALPWLALRSERQLGLFAPTFALRGADGPFAATGVHVPLWAGASAEVRPGIYLRGGSELSGALRTSTSTLRARWDHVDRDLVGLDAHGVLPVREGAVLWDADAIRGERARGGTTEIDAAARVHDRAAATLWLAPASVAAGVRAVARRGAAGTAFGPRISATGSFSRGPALFALAADASTLARGDGDTFHVARIDADAALSTFVGPLRAELDARASAAGLVGPDTGALDLGATARPGVSVPLARRYGEVVHALAPGLQAPIAAGRRGTGMSDGLGGPLAPIRGVAAAPGASLVSRLGRPGGDAAIVELGAGALLDGGTRGLGRLALAADGRLVRARVEAASLGRGEGLAISSLALGPRRGLRVEGSVEGRAAVEPIAARTLAVGALAPASSWLGSDGWSSRAEMLVPLAPFTAGVSALWDLGGATRLGERAELAYAHPCGCLAIAAVVSHRLGRAGTDASLALSLFP